jgi:hypothetical protein
MPVHIIYFLLPSLHFHCHNLTLALSQNYPTPSLGFSVYGVFHGEVVCFISTSISKEHVTSDSRDNEWVGEWVLLSYECWRKVLNNSLFVYTTVYIFIALVHFFPGFRPLEFQFCGNCMKQVSEHWSHDTGSHVTSYKLHTSLRERDLSFILEFSEQNSIPF